MPLLSLTSPVGPLSIAEEDGFIVALDWGWPALEDPSDLLIEARNQLIGYFDGKVTRFNLPFKPKGTDFQRRVWTALSQIAYGSTRSYGDIAIELNSAPRAVGGACGRNPIPILIPCHRVLGAAKRLGGYSGWDGITTKQALLRLEGVDL